MELYNRILLNLEHFQFLVDNPVNNDMNFWVCINCNTNYKYRVAPRPIHYYLDKPHSREIGVEYFTSTLGPLFLSFLCEDCKISTDDIDFEIVEMLKYEDPEYMQNLIEILALKK